MALKATHTTIASYSCSMRGYLPEDQDYKADKMLDKTWELRDIP
jgi:hypothetical protein